MLQIIYEMLVRSKAHKYIPKRSMSVKMLFNNIADCTTTLTRAELGKECHTDATLEDLISSVAQVSVNNIPDDTDIAEGEFASFSSATGESDGGEIDSAAENSTITNDGMKVKKRAVNAMALKNIRCLGIDKLEKGEIVMVRKKEEARHQRAIIAMQEMNVHVSEMTKRVNELSIQNENDMEQPIWWRDQVRFAREQSLKTHIV
jgi:hypothetical protein